MGKLEKSAYFSQTKPKWNIQHDWPPFCPTKIQILHLRRPWQYQSENLMRALQTERPSVSKAWSKSSQTILVVISLRQSIKLFKLLPVHTTTVCTHCRVSTMLPHYPPTIPIYLITSLNWCQTVNVVDCKVEWERPYPPEILQWFSLGVHVPFVKSQR